MALFDEIRMGAAGAGGDYEVERSLRFNSGDSPELTRTPSGAGSRTTWTLSFWAKIAGDDLSPHGFLFSTGANSSNKVQINLESSNRLTFEAKSGGSTQAYIRPSINLRDISAWYHFVIRVDTTDSTSTNRIKIYINGTQQTDLASNTPPSQNTEFEWNKAQEHNIGKRTYSNNYFNGYLAEINFIDGTALTPSSFAKTNATTGQWIPKKYGGSYGTNGFYLNFSDNSGTTATTLGKDSSGNGNNYTPNNFGTGDAVKDSPTNNFPTVNVLKPASAKAGTVNTGNLKVENGNHNLQRVNFYFGKAGIGTGKWYWEVRNQNGSYAQYVGITENFSEDGGEIANQTDKNFIGSHTSKTFSAGSGTGRTNQGSNKTMQFLLDVDNQELIAKYDGTTIFTDTSIPSGTTGQYVPYVFSTNDGGSGSLWADVIFNFGQDSTFGGIISAGGNADENGIGDFQYSVPSGYLAVCSKNMPDPTINEGKKYFETLTYTGTGTTAQTITGLEFQPDWVWIKSRDFSNNHHLFDAVRGVNKILRSSTEDSEDEITGVMSAFTSNGFTVQEAGGNNATNDNGSTFVAWNWFAGNSTVTNNDGNISAQQRVSATAGFSITTYTGTGNNNDTVGHGLGVTPDMVVIKTRNAVDSWVVESPHTSNARGMYWDMDNGSNTAGTDTTSRGTSTVQFVDSGDSNRHVNFSGENYVMYCFASVKGYSRINSYIANGNSDGRFIDTGFNPAFLITKRTNNNGSWEIHDNKRPPYNPHSNRLLIDSSTTEATTNHVDFVSNGFKIRNTFSGMNESSGDHYLYMAFGESPFKYARGK